MTTRTASFLAGLALSAALVGLAVAQQPAHEIIGYATAVDGDTIRLGAARVRLWGIDAPEAHQTCLDASRRSWACGEAATAAMRRMLAEGPVTCERKDTDRYGRTVAICRQAVGVVHGRAVLLRDLGDRMVALGLAIDYTRYSKGAYRDQQDAAKAERMGIWAGEFQTPAEWRREHQSSR